MPPHYMSPSLSKEGVYYGYKFGIRVPWVTGFPFNIASHPQYTGTVMTWMGLLLVLGGVPGLMSQGFGGFGLAILASYTLMACVEDDTI